MQDRVNEALQSDKTPNTTDLRKAARKEANKASAAKSRERAKAERKIQEEKIEALQIKVQQYRKALGSMSVKFNKLCRAYAKSTSEKEMQDFLLNTAVTPAELQMQLQVQMQVASGDLMPLSAPVSPIKVSPMSPIRVYASKVPSPQSDKLGFNTAANVLKQGVKCKRGLGEAFDEVASNAKRPCTAPPDAANFKNHAGASTNDVSFHVVVDAGVVLEFNPFEAAKKFSADAEKENPLMLPEEMLCIEHQQQKQQEQQEQDTIATVEALMTLGNARDEEQHMNDETQLEIRREKGAVINYADISQLINSPV